MKQQLLEGLRDAEGTAERTRELQNAINAAANAASNVGRASAAVSDGKGVATAGGDDTAVAAANGGHQGPLCPA